MQQFLKFKGEIEASGKDKEILLATLTASQVQQTSELKAYIDASKSSSSSGGGTNA